MKKLIDWLKSWLPSVRRQKRAEVLVALIAPNGKEVGGTILRPKDRIPERIDSSFLGYDDYVDELAAKINKKRNELGYMEHMEQQEYDKDTTK